MMTLTAKTPGVFDMTNVSAVCERAILSADQLRRAYKWTVELWEHLGVPPQIWNTGRGEPPIWRRGRDFQRARRGIEKAGFDGDFTSIYLSRMLPEYDSPGQQMAEFQLVQRSYHRGVWQSFTCLFPPAIGITEAETERYLLEFAALTAGRYGYMMYKKWNSAFWYVGSIIGQAFDDPATQEEEMANFRWSGEPSRSERVLRDLYPVNLLTQRYLDLPFGDTGSTLQEWIEKDAADRGTLEPLAGAEHVTVWRPVTENIPSLRTELFKAGLLFYWRHFDPSQPEHRDFSRPFTPPETIPAIFRPEFYAGRDPKVTR
jgi:hypothetical protein